jgi:uncharacterized protein (UPF0276 family)
VRLVITGDRVGIGFRAELAAGILSNLEHIDVVEVIADDYFGASRNRLRSLETLAAQVPVVLHGVSLGLASSSPVAAGRLDAMARVVDAVEPLFWSEHLAFVRANGLEIGHLAAPPRCAETSEGTAANVCHARAVVGSAPLLENIATLIEPPGSVCDEATFVSRTISAADTGLLLDLNNLFSNATNFGFDARDFLRKIPLDRVAAVHLAGGRWVRASNGERRLLDDHLHRVPNAVFDLLAEVGARAPRPLVVILERDGAYPPFAELLAELEAAREALSEGRRRFVASLSRPTEASDIASVSHGPVFEAYLARLYVDAHARSRFLSDPLAESRRAGLESADCDQLAALDVTGLELAAESFARKRGRVA